MIDQSKSVKREKMIPAKWPNALTRMSIILHTVNKQSQIHIHFYQSLIIMNIQILVYRTNRIYNT